MVLVRRFPRAARAGVSSSVQALFNPIFITFINVTLTKVRQQSPDSDRRIEKQVHLLMEGLRS